MEHRQWDNSRERHNHILQVNWDTLVSNERSAIESPQVEKKIEFPCPISSFSA